MAHVAGFDLYLIIGYHRFMADNSIKLRSIEKILFYIFLFLIPLQVRMIISWQGNDWDSTFFYLTDLLLVGVFILAAANTGLKGLRFKKTDFFLLLFLFAAAISIFVSDDKSISVFRFLKLLEFVFLYIYIMYRKEMLKSENLFGILFVSGIFQAILAIAQFFKQSSLGLKFIEAGTYSPGAPGVATFISGAEKVMRAYGSFPHPNVLAAFLMLAIFSFYALWLKKQIKPLAAAGLIVLIFALFLTFSREAVFTFVVVSLVFFLVRFFQLRALSHGEERLAAGKRTMALVLFFVVFSAASALYILPYFKTRFVEISLQEEAIDLRFFYNKMAVEIIKEKPVFGIGIGDFVNYSRNFPAFLRAANKIANPGEMTGQQIPEWIYQPVHNIYLLIAAEIGILGALFFVVFVIAKVINVLKRLKPKELSELAGPMVFLFAGFLIIGLSDHFFWTLQSGAIMFWLGLAII